MGRSTLLTTAQLTLSPVAPDDAADTARLMTPAISGMLTTWPERMSTDQAGQRIAQSIAERQEGLWIDWALRLTATGELVGWAGLGRKVVSETRLNIGIWLGEAYQGLGLGGEAVAAVTHFASGCATALVAQIDHANRRSIRLFEKQGFRLLEEQEMYSPVRGSGSPAFVYELLVGKGRRWPARIRACNVTFAACA